MPGIGGLRTSNRGSVELSESCPWTKMNSFLSWLLQRFFYRQVHVSIQVNIRRRQRESHYTPSVDDEIGKSTFQEFKRTFEYTRTNLDARIRSRYLFVSFLSFCLDGRFSRRRATLCIDVRSRETRDWIRRIPFLVDKDASFAFLVEKEL